MYAIIDVETTGGNPRTDRITEIAILRFDGQRIIDRYVQLVNPQQEIPPRIVSLTGITNEMVVDAPLFKDVASIVNEKIEGAYFVAHNAKFDHAFLKNEFKRIDHFFKRIFLCTVLLSRRLLPDIPSYSLGSLCEHLNITNEARHRAEGDARATVELFKHLMNADKNQSIQKLIRKLEQPIIPYILQEKWIPKLPETTGVFYLHNMRGDIIYLNKAKNIQKRVVHLFLNDWKSRQHKRKREDVKSISFEETGNDMVASIIYCLDKERINPIYQHEEKKQISAAREIKCKDNFLLIDKGRTHEEVSIVHVEEGRLKGIGFIDPSVLNDSFDIWKSVLKPYPHTEIIDRIIDRYIKKGVEQVLL